LFRKTQNNVPLLFFVLKICKCLFFYSNDPIPLLCCFACKEYFCCKNEKKLIFTERDKEKDIDRLIQCKERQKSDRQELKEFIK
jgi:hypothetical protein